MKKPLRMIWAAGDLPPFMTGGRTYTITGKFLLGAGIPGRYGGFTYVFKNDQGQEDNAASRLFAPIKRKRR